MPMYFPDLESVKNCAKSMKKNIGENKYKGIVPKNEIELIQARIELARYFREVWNDDLQALEIELAVTKENYEQKIGEAIKNRFINS